MMFRTGGEDAWAGVEGNWEGLGEFEDYLAEFEDGESYAWEYSALFRAFSAETKSPIPGGWETIDRRNAKMKAAAK